MHESMQTQKERMLVFVCVCVLFQPSFMFMRFVRELESFQRMWPRIGYHVYACTIVNMWYTCVCVCVSVAQKSHNTPPSDRRAKRIGLVVSAFRPFLKRPARDKHAHNIHIIFVYARAYLWNIMRLNGGDMCKSVCGCVCVYMYSNTFLRDRI